jgi:hypothetical protein
MEYHICLYNQGGDKPVLHTFPHACLQAPPRPKKGGGNPTLHISVAELGMVLLLTLILLYFCTFKIAVYEIDNRFAYCWLHLKEQAIKSNFISLHRRTVSDNKTYHLVAYQNSYLKGHGNEADFLGFLHKSVRHRSLTLH